MKISVADANILIDLIELSLDQDFFELPFEIWTTKSVMLELHDSQQNILVDYMDKFALNIDDSPINEDLKFSRSLTIADQSVLCFAYNKKALLLTGDKPVRKWCTNHNIEVHGILWVLDQLIENNLIHESKGASKLSYLMSINNRLPEDQCLIRLKKWKS